MITGVEIKYRAETLSFPEAALTHAHADPPQTAGLVGRSLNEPQGMRWQRRRRSK